MFLSRVITEGFLHRLDIFSHSRILRSPSVIISAVLPTCEIINRSFSIKLLLLPRRRMSRVITEGLLHSVRVFYQTSTSRSSSVIRFRLLPINAVIDHSRSLIICYPRSCLSRVITEGLLHMQAFCSQCRDSRSPSVIINVLLPTGGIINLRLRHA